MLWPNGSTSRPPISSPFGPRDVTQQGASSNHMGTDFIGFAMVRAVAAGRVVSVGWRDGWSGGGYMVWIQHDGFLSRSLHLVNQSAQVSVGDYVAEGQAIGLMGTTASPYPVGRHLHLEIVVNGRQVDPVPFITAGLSSGAALAGGASTEGFLMGLSDAEQTEVHQALKQGGSFTPNQIINILRTEISPAIAAIALGGIAYPGAPQWNAFQTIVNVVREDDGREMPVIDPKDFASSVAPLLAPLLADNLGTLSDETIAEIAKAAADEQARRLAS